MDITEIRLRNVDHIIAQQFNGVRSSFARHIDRDPSAIGRWWVNSKNRKNIGHRYARLIEDRLKLPDGWLDQPHEDYELEKDHQKKHLIKVEHGDTHVIPLHHSATLNQQYQLSIIDNKKGKLMLLSTDGDAYAFQLVGHNPNQLLNKNWGLVVEPGTPLAEDEYTLLYLSNGEILLRMLTYQDDQKLLISHPVTAEQQEIPRNQIDKALYCYIGIPPSKIMVEDSGDR